MPIFGRVVRLLRLAPATAQAADRYPQAVATPRWRKSPRLSSRWSPSSSPLVVAPLLVVIPRPKRGRGAVTSWSSSIASRRAGARPGRPARRWTRHEQHGGVGTWAQRKRVHQGSL